MRRRQVLESDYRVAHQAARRSPVENDELGLKAMSAEIVRPGSHELPADMTPPVQDPGTTKILTGTDKCRLAEQIDERVTTILKQGGTDIDIFI